MITLLRASLIDNCGQGYSRIQGCHQTTSTRVGVKNSGEEAGDRESRHKERDLSFLLRQIFTFWAKNTDFVGRLSVAVWLECNIFELKVKL